MAAHPSLPPADFREYAWLLSPGTWRGYWGKRFVGVIAMMFDTLSDGAIAANRVSKFGSRNFPSDALPLLGQERVLPRYPGEADGDWSERLHDAWVLWHMAGTGGGLIEMYSRLGMTVTLEKNGTWDWDSDPDNWSRFWVVIDDHSWVSDGVWDDLAYWDDGGTWDTSATPDEVRAVRGIVRTFKEAHAICPAICVVLDGATWAANQPDGTWGDYANRSPSASYWDG